MGLYRDIRKWPKRDLRPQGTQKSIVNFDWLSPYSVGEIIEGKKILEKLQDASGNEVALYNYYNYVIKSNSLQKGIENYDMALRIYMGAVLKRVRKRDANLTPPSSTVGTGQWTDLSGLLLPVSEEEHLIEDIKNGNLESIQDVLQRFEDINEHYRDYQWAWTYQLILDYYHLNTITPQDADRIREDYIQARRKWIAAIRKDAEKEFAMGDVEQNVLDDFLDKLDHEVDYEE